MIVESEMPDVCKKLNQLVLDYWNASSDKKADVKREYKQTWQAAWLSGFKITRKRVRDEHGAITGVKHFFKSKSKLFDLDANGKQFKLHCKNNISDLKIVDMRPEGFKTPSGYCTTNAMAQVLPLSFEDIYKKQRKHGADWNCAYVYEPILASHGFEKIRLSKKLATFKVADKLFSIKTPFLAQSAYHITCIDNRGSKPCVNDFWDSRRCRIETLYVKKCDAERVKRIMDRDDI